MCKPETWPELETQFGPEHPPKNWMQGLQRLAFLRGFLAEMKAQPMPEDSFRRTGASFRITDAQTQARPEMEFLRDWLGLATIQDRLLKRRRRLRERRQPAAALA